MAVRAPEFRNRCPEEIITKNVMFDSAGYLYRGLSWLDYAKRKTSVCALEYAALDVRQAIEQLLFEELILSVGGDLDRRYYEKCKGNSTKLHKIVHRLSPEYERLVQFAQAVMSVEPNAPALIKWEHGTLMKQWGIVSNYLHWRGKPKETVESSEWFGDRVSGLYEIASNLWDNMTRGYSGVMMPDGMQPEIRNAWEDYKNGIIDLEGVKVRAMLALSMLLKRGIPFSHWS